MKHYLMGVQQSKEQQNIKETSKKKQPGTSNQKKDTE